MSHQSNNRRPRQRTEYLRRSVSDAVRRPEKYVLKADKDTGDLIKSIELVEPEQKGAMSVLEASWQEEQLVERLEEDECSALARAGFRVRKTRGVYWVVLREKAVSRLFVAHVHGEWSWSRAKSIRSCRFRSILEEGSLLLPLWDQYPSTAEAIIRETAYAALQALVDKAPHAVLSSHLFYGGLRILCDEAVHLMKTDPGFWDLVYDKIPRQTGAIIVEDVEQRARR